MGTVAVVPLLRAAHFGPTIAVTAVVALLAHSFALTLPQGAVITSAAFLGQLTVGWGNDLVDARRDREVGRRDKPLATGELSSSVVRTCLVLAGVGCVVLSLLAGWRSGLTHLALGVAFGHLYNLRLKSTPWSWLPYAVAFGALPVAVRLAGTPPQLPPLWMIGAAATLGVAAHFLNTLPDLADDEATGVRGLPHRLGAVRSRLLATALLVLASATTLVGPAAGPTRWTWLALVVVLALAAVALSGRGRVPFYAAIAIALVDVVLLTDAAP